MMERSGVGRVVAAMCIAASIVVLGLAYLAPPLRRPLIALATWLAAAAGRAFRQGTGGAR